MQCMLCPSSALRRWNTLDSGVEVAIKTRDCLEDMRMYPHETYTWTRSVLCTLGSLRTIDTVSLGDCISSVVGVSSPDRLALSNTGLSLSETMWCLFRSRSTLGTIQGWAQLIQNKTPAQSHVLISFHVSFTFCPNPPLTVGTCSDELCCEVPSWRPVQPPAPPRLLYLHHQCCSQHTECWLHGEQLYNYVVCMHAQLHLYPPYLFSLPASPPTH